LFGALCEALARKRAQNGRSVSNSGERENSLSDQPPAPPVNPSPAPARPGYTVGLFSKNSLAVRNAALSAIVGGITDTVAALSMTSYASPTKPTTQTPSQAPAIPQSSVDNNLPASADATGDGPDGKNYRMDVQDFME
jgi:hypothetical protein